jgi:SpoVK/Ycf46/Vps4 family AAA+-type ATPase
LVEQELATNSIYRGKAIDGQENPEFIDLSGVDPAQVIFTEEVTTQLQANVWTLIEHTAKMRELGVPLKRSVLLEGPYGTGKTLAGYLTAQIATANGWTSIYCRPGRDNLDQVMGLARLYQPAVVFFEDVDTIAAATPSGTDGVTSLLDTFDGINAKGTELLAVLTTNHKDSIHKGMLRPGRLDAMIHIGALDADGLRRLVESSVPESMLGEIDHPEVAKAMEGFLPAFAKETIDRATRYNVARNNGETTKLETADFVEAATGLLPQLELMEEADEKRDVPQLEQALKPVLAQTLGETQLYDLENEYVTHELRPGGNGNH